MGMFNKWAISVRSCRALTATVLQLFCLLLFWQASGTTSSTRGSTEMRDLCLLDYKLVALTLLLLQLTMALGTNCRTLCHKCVPDVYSTFLVWNVQTYWLKAWKYHYQYGPECSGYGTLEYRCTTLVLLLSISACSTMASLLDCH